MRSAIDHAPRLLGIPPHTASRPGALLGELADLVRDDREALAGLAGAGRLDGRVEREEVRLVGDARDRLGELLDLLRRLAQAPHLRRAAPDRGGEVAQAIDRAGTRFPHVNRGLRNGSARRLRVSGRAHRDVEAFGQVDQRLRPFFDPGRGPLGLRFRLRRAAGDGIRRLPNGVARCREVADVIGGALR